MRAALALMALLPGLACAQFFDPGPAVRYWQAHLPTNPLRDPVNPPNLDRHGDLPPPYSDPRDLEVIRAGYMSREGDVVTLIGGVEFVFRGYRVFADRAEGDLSTDVFHMFGNVKVVGDSAIIYGESVTINTKNRTFTADNSRSTFPPTTIQGAFLDNLYVTGQHSEGGQRESIHFHSLATTCNLDHPHFDLYAERTDIRTGRRVIFHKVKVQLFGRTVLELPFLSVPLDQDRYKYMPEVGHTNDEGYYIKNRYGIPLNGNDNFDARVDYMTKLGAGLGGDWYYRNRTMEGLVNLYQIVGPGNGTVISNNHRQLLPFGEFSFQTNYQDNYYLTTPGSRLLSNRAQLQIPTKNATTVISYASTDSASFGSKSGTQNYSISDTRQYGKGTFTSVQLGYNQSSNSYQGASSFDSKNLDLRFTATQPLPFADAQLLYQRNIPVGDSPYSYGGSDQTPVVSLNSDSTRLLGLKMGRKYPFRTSLSWGEFGDLSDDRVNRAYLDFNYSKSEQTSKNYRLNYVALFRQGVYSDDTAQYTVGANLSSVYTFGRDTAATITYNYLRPEGYTPVAVDRNGNNHNTTMDISYRPQRYVLVGAQTGYDFLRARTSDIGWQQVGVRADLLPSSAFQLRTISTYDTLSEVWSSFRADITYHPGETYLSVGARYDGYQRQWSNANVFLNNLKWGKTRFSAVLSYNGFTKQIDAVQYNVVYDLHCFEAVVNVSDYRTGFRPGVEVQFFLRLKALPSSSGFGIGTRGQPLGTGTGF